MLPEQPLLLISSNSSLMVKKPITVKPNLSVADAVALMHHTAATCLLVVDQQQLLGCFTAEDLVRVVASGNNLKEVELMTVMTSQIPVILEQESDNAQAVWQVMQRYGVQQLPVVNAANQPVGIITQTDLLKHLAHLNPSNEKLNHSCCSLFGNSIEGIFRTTPDGYYLSVNHALAHMHGYHSPQEMMTSINNISEQLYVYPEYRNEFIRVVESIGRVQGFEAQVYHRDGSIFWVSENGWIVRDEQGQTLYYEGTCVDISDRKRLEAQKQQAALELQTSEARLRHLYHNAPVMMYSIDQEGRICDVNQTWLEKLGYSREETIGQRVDFLMPPESAARAAQVLTYFWQTRYAKDVPYQYTKKDGTIMEVIVNCVAATTPTGDRISLSVVQDVTEQRQAERALQYLNLDLEFRVNQRTDELKKTIQRLQKEIAKRQHTEALLLKNEAQFQQLTANVPGMIYQYVLYADGSQAFTYISPACQTIYEIPPEDVIQNAEALWQVIHPDDVQTKIDKIKNSAQTLEALSVEYRIITASGALKWLRSESRPKKQLDSSIIWDGIITDITEHKQTEEALQHSEENFRQLAENIHSIFWITDRQGKILYVSPAYEAIWGRSCASLYASPNSWLDAVHPQDRDRISTSLRKLNQSDQEYRIIQPNGTIRWIRSRTFLVRNQFGKVHRIVGISDDITPSKDMQEALEKSEEQFRTFFNESPFGIALTDKNHRLIQVNPAYCLLMGYSEDELSQISFIDLTHPDDLTEDLDLMQQLLARQIAKFQIEKRFIRRNGEVFRANLTVVPIFDLANNLLYTLGTIEDITEQKQAEEALKQSEERLHLVLQNMPVMLDVFDSNNNLIVWNQECERVTGYSAAEMIGNPNAMQLLYPDPIYLQTMLTLWQDQGNDYRNWEWDIVCKDGTRKTIAWSNISEEFPVTGWDAWAIGVDVSDRKQAEVRMLDALNQERELNELKSEFITTVSHEFRTPLSTILSSTELLERYGQQWDEDKRQLRYKRIIEAVDRMTELLNDVLIVGKAEAGRLEFNPTPINVLEVCQELLEELHLNLKEKHTLRFIHEDCGNTTFYLDLQLLRHILDNLISNAIKYSPKGGEIHLKLVCQPEQVIFQIQDHGIGISIDDQEQLFTIFKRGKNVGTISGTGLGLTIVRRCVDLHGGSIAVESALGKGTLITIKLPSAPGTK